MVFMHFPAACNDSGIHIKLVIQFNTDNMFPHTAIFMHKETSQAKYHVIYYSN